MSGFLQRAIEQRAINVLIGNPMDPAYWVQKLFLGQHGGPATSGIDVTPESALSWTALSAGVRISAETLGSLPWSVFEETPGEGIRPAGKIERPNHPLHFLIHAEPNEEMTSMEFFETAQAHALWWGGSASQIIRNQAGIIQELWPLNPDRCRWERDPDGSLWLRVTLPRDRSGGVMGSTRLPSEEVLWVRGFSTGGIWGACLPALHREAIGLGLAGEMFIAGFFGRGLTAGGILEHPKTLSKEAQARLRTAVDKQVGGIDRAHRLLILEEGAKWVQTSIDPEKAQLLGLRQFQIAEASRILRIPPHMLADLSRATFSNIESQSIEFVQNHVRPWVVRWEQRLNKQLLGQKRFTVHADLDALMRRSFNYARAVALAYLRDHGGQRTDLYAATLAIRVLPTARKRQGHPCTPAEAWTLACDLGPVWGRVWLAQCLTGMGGSELWGEWAPEDGGLAIRGTKRAGRHRLVPLVYLLERPPLSLSRGIMLFRKALKAASRGTVQPYDGRRSYLKWLALAGIVPIHQDAYAGHGPKSMTALYQQGNVGPYLAADAAALLKVVRTLPAALRARVRKVFGAASQEAKMLT